MKIAEKKNRISSLSSQPFWLCEFSVQIRVQRLQNRQIGALTFPTISICRQSTIWRFFFISHVFISLFSVCFTLLSIVRNIDGVPFGMQIWEILSHTHMQAQDSAHTDTHSDGYAQNRGRVESVNIYCCCCCWSLLLLLLWLVDVSHFPKKRNSENFLFPEWKSRTHTHTHWSNGFLPGNLFSFFFLTFDNFTQIHNTIYVSLPIVKMQNFVCESESTWGEKYFSLFSVFILAFCSSSFSLL